jgi:hypothetical protein
MTLLLYPRERAPCIHWIGGWMGPRAILNVAEKRKIAYPFQESNSNSLAIQPMTPQSNSSSSALAYVRITVH